MLCSSYIATKLKTWSDNGMKKLMLLLARMRFRLEDCKQKFQYMNVEIKRKMKEEFEEFLPEYGLNDFYYRGFCLLHGYSSRISAADVVYGVTALLESFVESDGSCASKQFGVAYYFCHFLKKFILTKSISSKLRTLCYEHPLNFYCCTPRFEL
ncbi:hypothetical protein CsSME_00024812 [Camellia sinensis var. sinensis]